MAGSAEVGLMIKGAGPGILKLIVSVAVLTLAAVMASRRLQCVRSQTPSETSSVVLTTYTRGPDCGVTVGVTVGVLVGVKVAVAVAVGGRVVVAVGEAVGI